MAAVYFYRHDHPPDHFHARYGGQWATVAIADLAILASDLPPRALGLVLEWAQLHRAELQANWERASQRLPLDQMGRCAKLTACSRLWLKSAHFLAFASGRALQTAPPARTTCLSWLGKVFSCDGNNRVSSSA